MRLHTASVPKGAGRKPAPSVISGCSFSRVPSAVILAVPSVVLTRAILFLLLLGLAYPAFPRFRFFADRAVFAPRQSALSAPYVYDVLEEDLDNALRPGEGEKRLLGTFKVSNEAAASFVLHLRFEHGGKMRHKDEKVETRVGLKNLELRFKDDREQVVVKDLSDSEYGGRDGGVYEVLFLSAVPGDIRDVYELELWGTVDEDDTRRARNGSYVERVEFSIEVIDH